MPVEVWLDMIVYATHSDGWRSDMTVYAIHSDGWRYKVTLVPDGMVSLQYQELVEGSGWVDSGEPFDIPL